MKLKDSVILVVDDDEAVLVAVQMLLKPHVRKLVTEKNPENLHALLTREKFDAIILDMNYKSVMNTGNEGFYWLNKIRETEKDLVIIMITAYGDIDLAIRSLKEGAADFLIKPWRNEKVIETLTLALEKKQATGQSLKDEKPKVPQSRVAGGTVMIGSSDIMQEVLYKIDKIGPTDANVLVLGENGTGKDLVARMLHERSHRAGKPFVAVDLGSLTETLFESELFGHKKGAFTDAREDRTGRMEAASGGTLFLDEIGNISLYQQAKLLSVLQNKQVIRLGTNQVIPIDIRLISATNVPIYELAAESKFRKDLIYRINTVEIKLPPLRSRGNDITLLANHFLKVFAAAYKKTVDCFDAEALQKLQRYSWPGNIRELQHTIERSLIMCDDNCIRAADIDFSTLEANLPVLQHNESFRLKEIEKDAILKVIDKHKGNITQAARELGLTRTALYRRLSKHDL